MPQDSRQLDAKAERLKYLQSRSGDITSYFGMIGDAFSKKVNLLAQLIQDAHDPSLGAYKESLLRNTIGDFLPKQYEVATGFVLFPMSASPQFNLVELGGALGAFAVSKQLDIIVFDSHRYPVLFRDGNFVVLRPESVRAIIEVKGTISSSHVKNALDCLYDYSGKWVQCRALYEEWEQPTLPEPALYVYGFQYYMDKDGNEQTDGTRLRKQIVEFHKTKFPDGTAAGVPLLLHLFVYDDVCISNAVRVNDGGMQLGFSTNRGRLVRYVDQKPEFAGDGTVAALLGDVHVRLDTGFNQFFSYVEQSPKTDVLAHEHAGFDVWLEGDAADAVVQRLHTEQGTP